jgi:hypothetical protein
MAFEPHGVRTDLGAALDFVNCVLRRRAVVFVVSDWMATSYHRPLEIMARRHDVVALHVVDPRERALPAVGLMTLRDPETGRSRIIDASDPVIRERLHRRAAAFDEALERSLRLRGIGLVRLRTDQSYVVPLLHFFQARERMGRR